MEVYRANKDDRTQLNVFTFLKPDPNHNSITQVYFYQYEAYLKNLRFKKLIDILIIGTAFCLFMDVVYTIMGILNPAIVLWDNDLMVLMEVSSEVVPPAYHN